MNARPCPCCHGDLTGETFDLCDICLEAAMEGRYPHGCARPVTSKGGAA